MQKKNAWIIFAISTIVLLALDLWLKSWAFTNLQEQDARVIVPGVLGLTYHKNPGALFGFLSTFNARWVLAALKVFILFMILWYYKRLPTEKRFWLIRVPVILIFTGGLGNLFDRIALGYVRDMLDFLFMNFAVFNLADVYVTVGVFMLMFVTFFVVKDFPLP